MSDSCKTIEFNDLGGVNGITSNTEIIVVVDGQPRRMTVETFLQNLSASDTNTNLANTDLTLLANRIHQLESFILAFMGGKVTIGATDGLSRLTVAQGDIETATPGDGYISTDDDGKRWRIKVTPQGAVEAEPL